MIPNIFISSTIEDLHHLRDATRDTIAELGYNPVMSEYGDIGYLPTASAEDSCYMALQDCQLAVILIGKRYGSISGNNISITQNESRVARTKGIPLISLVDQEVLTFKRVHDASTAGSAVFPGMDHPEKTFVFIQETMDSPLNNGVLAFSNVSDARDHLKHQLAHLVGDLLRNRFDPLKAEIKDVLSEIATLRHELTAQKDKDFSPQKFLRAMRFLLDDEHKSFRDLLEHICESLDSAIPILLRSKTFDEFLKSTGADVQILDEEPNINNLFEERKLYSFHESLPEGVDPKEGEETLFWGLLVGKGVVMNLGAKLRFDSLFVSFNKVAG